MENNNIIKGVLIDTTKCIGCRGCQTACKQWNELPGEETVFHGSYENPPDLSPKTYTKVNYVEGSYNDKFFWRFWKEQCRQCLQPACASACLVNAIEKTETGPVTYNKSKCMGCRYCMIACPFNVPKFEYDKVIPQIRKCVFCFDRQENGYLPACVKTCPTGALTFGERNELIEIARSRIYKEPDKYIHHVYGEHEAGGTSWLYISDVPFEELGFNMDIGTNSYPELTKDFLYGVPITFILVPAALLALSQIRKDRIEKVKKVKELENK